MNAKNGMRPVHPGEILREGFDTLVLSADALSNRLGVPANRTTLFRAEIKAGRKIAECVKPRQFSS